MEKLIEVLERFKTDIGPMFIACGVIAPDGIPVSEIVIAPTFNAKEGEVRGTMAMILSRQICQRLQLGPMEELMMTSDMGFFMSVDLGNTFTLMVGVVKQATLGALRVVIKEFFRQIVDACPQVSIS